MKIMTFKEAKELLRNGIRVTRIAWKGTNRHVRPNKKLGYMRLHENNSTAWLPNSLVLNTTDWIKYELPNAT